MSTFEPTQESSKYQVQGDCTQEACSGLAPHAGFVAAKHSLSQIRVAHMLKTKAACNTASHHSFASLDRTQMQCAMFIVCLDSVDVPRVFGLSVSEKV